MTRLLRIGIESARAWIHCAYQHYIGRIRYRPGSAGYSYLRVLKWLAKHLESFSAELRQFIEEQYSVVSQAQLAGFYIRPATDEPDTGFGQPMIEEAEAIAEAAARAPAREKAKAE